MKKKKKTTTRKTATKKKTTAKAKKATPAKARKVASRRVTKSVAAPAAIRQVPTRDQIRMRAYERFVARGGQHGFAMEDWFAAERELTNEQRAE